MLSCDKLFYSVGGQSLIENLSLDIEPGEVVAVLGANGAGKSTLTKLLSGELEPDSGEVNICGRPLKSLSAIERARKRAVMPQRDSLNFGFSGFEVACLGRFPWQPESSEKSGEIVSRALFMAGAQSFSKRSYTQLSGGERARVQLARVIAQMWAGECTADSRFLLLDEPTASLDIAHQHEVMQAVRQLSISRTGVLVVMHDLNLAARYANRIALLASGRLIALGAPEQALSTDNLKQAYGIDFRLIKTGEVEPNWIVPRLG